MASVIHTYRDTAETDCCSEAGNERLATRIREYWRARGFFIATKVKPKGFFPQARSAVFAVETDMVNGMPKGMMHNG